MENTKNAIMTRKKAKTNFKYGLMMRAIAWVIAISCGIIALVQSMQLEALLKEYNKSVESKTIEDTTDFILTEKTFLNENAMTKEKPVTDDMSEILSTLYTLPYNEEYTGRKSYEDYTMITDKTSDQYKLQTMAWTNTDAFRMIDDRYLVAIGTYFEAPCGTLFDIILENSVKIPCIVGDIKADIHTDARNVYSGGVCATEFMVDVYGIADTNAYITGDISSNFADWQSKVTALRVYEKNILSDLSGKE